MNLGNVIKGLNIQGHMKKEQRKHGQRLMAGCLITVPIKVDGEYSQSFLHCPHFAY